MSPVPAKTSAVWPVDEALEAAALADAALAAILVRDVGEDVGWYAGRAPQESTFPYVTNDDATEDRFHLFQADGQVNLRILSVWSNISKKVVLEIYQHLFRILHDQKIVVTGYGTVQCKLRLVTCVAEPDTGIHHAIAEATVWTLRA